MTDTSRPHFLGLLAGLFLAAGLVFSAFVVTRAWMLVAQRETIHVTGSARKNVRADLIIWQGTFSTEASTLLDAQRTLKASLTKVESFLKAKAVGDYIISPIDIEEIRPRRDAKDGESRLPQILAYRLKQSVEIRSPDVDRIVQVSRDSTELVEQGVLFVAGVAKYIYTKAGEAKVEMLAEATNDARARADQIAQKGGRQIGRLLSAKMGVFQITPLYATETSWEGMNDVTSVEKTVTAVVTAAFSMQ